jgi:GT2 family glycosyltransferase
VSRLSVLVVSYGVRDLLRRCLASLEPARLRGDLEVVVADNASGDGSGAMVHAEFPGVRLLEQEENRGFAAAVNAAAQLATGDVLLLLNPDTEVPPAALPRLADALGDASVVGFRQVDAHGRAQLANGPSPGLANELFRRFVQRRLDRGDRIVAALHDRLLSRRGEVAWVAGSSMLVRRAAFDQVGGFDEGFFLYFEDIDFCLRVRAAGGTVCFEPRVTVLHHRGASMATAPEAAARAYRTSQLRFWEKHHGRWARRLVETYLRARGLAPSGVSERSDTRT